MWTDNCAELATNIKENKYKNVVITTHHKPDGDALGSSLGLYWYLKNFINNIQIISPTDYPNFLTFLPGEENIINYEANNDVAIEYVKNADLIFCLDFNVLYRINELGKHIENANTTIVMIDHHLEPKWFATYNFHNTQISSTCELIYLFIEKYFNSDSVNQKIANCLYTGVMTDTGNFAHSNTTSNTHTVAAKLLDKGAEHLMIHEKIYDVFSQNRSRLFGYCLYKKLEIIPEVKCALIYLSKNELAEFHVQTGDTEGLVNFGLSIEGIKLSVLIIDRSVMVKMSFRSKGNFAVNEFAAKYFNGGGHKNASGGQSNDTLENVVTKFKNEIINYKDQII